MSSIYSFCAVVITFKNARKICLFLPDVAKNAVLGRGQRTFAAADGNIRETGVGISLAAAKFRQRTRKVKLSCSVWQKLPVARQQRNAAERKNKLAAVCFFGCENGGILHGAAESTVGTDNDVGLL